MGNVHDDLVESLFAGREMECLHGVAEGSDVKEFPGAIVSKQC